MKDGEKLLLKPHKRTAHNSRYNNGRIELISSKPFSSPHIALYAGLQVASEKISIIPARQKNSDIEQQACDGNLFAG